MSRLLDLWAGMTGTVLDFAGATAPADWLMCYGQAVSRTTYANLFAAIGTTYGAGDGSTTFNLPDCRGRVGAGKDDMGGSAASRLTTGGSGVNGAALGATGGAQTHVLTVNQLANHSHTQVAVNSSAGSSGYPAQSNSSSGTNVAGTTQAAGMNEAHNNTQPTIVFNKIIKT